MYTTPYWDTEFEISSLDLQAKNFAPKINEVEVYVGVKNQNIFFLNIVMTRILRGENFLEFFYEQDSKFPQEKKKDSSSWDLTLSYSFISKNLKNFASKNDIKGRPEDFRKFLACEKNSARYTFFEDRQKKNLKFGLTRSFKI